MNVIQMKGAREAPRSERSKMETLLLTPQTMDEWLKPPFQRQKKITNKVRAVAEEIKTEGGIIPGIITLGQIEGEKRIFLLDGQHRVEAAKMSGLEEFIADVRIYRAADMADMGEEFVRLNSSLVRMQPDDVLRGLEQALPTLKQIRRDCPFVGYDNIRRNENAPLISMGTTLRCWARSQTETPATTTNVTDLARDLTDEETEHLIRFLLTARAAWGSDPAYYRLWSNLNLSLCMWLYRRLVIDRSRAATKRVVVLGIEQFKKCLMAVSASSDYVDWLVGRNLTERDRAPAYKRIKTAFERRLRDEGIGGHRAALPSPAWASR